MKLFTFIHGCSSEKHGKRTPEYRAYANAKSRCNNPKFTGYEYYGGRGIEFRFSSFLEFLHEVGLRPSKTHSIDRKNSEGHYEKGNVHWATKQDQSRNTRNHSHNTSGYRGVSQDKRDGKWRAYIFSFGKQLSLGYFSNPIDAAKVRDKAAHESYGESAKLNFPLEIL